jgi:hypothetical protein
LRLKKVFNQRRFMRLKSILSGLALFWHIPH